MEWNILQALSQKLSAAQRNYSVTELECLAAVVSVKKFRPYIEGLPFKILTCSVEMADWTKRLVRYTGKMGSLQRFDFIIEYSKGKMTFVSESLSRGDVEEIAQDPSSAKQSFWILMPVSSEPQTAAYLQGLKDKFRIDRTNAEADRDVWVRWAGCMVPPIYSSS